jgi:hypothetical protein
MSTISHKPESSQREGTATVLPALLTVHEVATEVPDHLNRPDQAERAQAPAWRSRPSRQARKNGLNGLNGATGATGLQGPTGATGAPGQPGPFPPTLPSGKTLRGVFLSAGSASAAGGFVGDNITFGWTLSAKPTVHFIKVGATVPVGCSGTAVAPGAHPGNLCVFEVENTNVDDTVSRVWSPPANAMNTAETYGAAVFSTSVAGGVYEFGGSWAVTAP